VRKDEVRREQPAQFARVITSNESPIAGGSGFCNRRFTSHRSPAPVRSARNIACCRDNRRQPSPARRTKSGLGRTSRLMVIEQRAIRDGHHQIVPFKCWTVRSFALVSRLICSIWRQRS